MSDDGQVPEANNEETPVLVTEANSTCSKSVVIKLERLNSELVEALLKALNEKLENNRLLQEASFVRRSQRQTKTEEKEKCTKVDSSSGQNGRRCTRLSSGKSGNDGARKSRRSERTAVTERKSNGTGSTEAQVSNKENEDSESDSEVEQRRSKRTKAAAKRSPEDKKRRRRHSSDEEFRVKTSGRKKSDSDQEFEAMLDDEKVSSESYFSDSSGSDWSGKQRPFGFRRRKRKVSKAFEYAEFAKTITGKGKGKMSDDGEHYGFCQKCKEGGEIICCLTCRWSYHLLCLNPPLQHIPDGKWQCPRCSVEELPGKPNKILGWRWKESKEERENFAKLSAFEQKLAAKPQREYLVHWTDQSYWKCSWVGETQMSICHTVMLRNFERNIESFEEEMCVLGDSADPLYERFYKYGVDPQWLQIHKVINHRRMYGKNEYLVKWRRVPYTEVSWEKADDQEIPDFKRFQEIYHEWKMVFQGDADYEFKHITPPPESPIGDLTVKFESQPPFVDTAGGLSLHDYQLDSLNWLRQSWHNGTSTILADEMGLGKTIQAIIFLYSLYKEGHSTGPFLVCAPLSTVMNWEREFELWAPDMYVVTYTGFQDERIVIRENELSDSFSRPKGCKAAGKIRGDVKFHVLLTSYEYITKDLSLLSSVSWVAMVVDEGHRLKNNKSKFFDNLNNYDAKYKLILSGTPLQNNLQELFNMLYFLCPDDREEFESLEQQFSTDEINYKEQVLKLHSLLFSRMLRRVKEDVLKDLPTKTEIIVKVELSPMQKKYYKYILTKNFEALNSKSGGHWATLMYVIVDLQKCCNHPYLFSTAMMKAPVLPSDIYETTALVKASGKLGLLQKMLRGLQAGGNRVLIFSHSIKMLDILEDFLEGEGYEYERIDGSDRGSDRQSAIDRFNAPDAKQFVFLLSTKAGGLGINLATADTVILYDSDWNPHNDVQAFSRAHRIGQKKKVMIYRFVTRHSIEERIAQVARKKLMLNHVVLDAGKGDVSLALSKQQLDGIIRYGTKELFKENADNVRDNFTDEVIRDLLDRSKTDAAQNEGDDPQNDFLSSLKIVSHVTAEDVVDISSDEENTAPDYWTQIMGEHCQKKVVGGARPGDLVNGRRRRRKRVSYKVPGENDPFSDSDSKEVVEVIDIDDAESSSGSDSDIQIVESDEEIPPIEIDPAALVAVVQSDSDEVQVLDSDSDSSVLSASSSDSEDSSSFSESDHSVHTVEDSDSEDQLPIIISPEPTTEDSESESDAPPPKVPPETPPHQPSIDLSDNDHSQPEPPPSPQSTAEDSNDDHTQPEASTQSAIEDSNNDDRERDILQPRSDVALEVL